ncbi:glycosyltransferase family 4 protein [Methanolobus sp. ZRKC5]|uniref:glycosyltransferase family 4 protein n=1 Tax=unclassified Methanolobus TaxID=2629569 RepID=UPI00313E05EC
MSLNKNDLWVIVTPYWLPVLGGVTSCVVNLTRQLESFDGSEVEVISLEGESDSSSIHIYGSRNKIIFLMDAFWKIKRLKPQILHSHSWWYTYLPCLVYKFLHPSVVLIHTFHTDPLISKRLSLSSKIKNWLFTSALNQSNAITFVSKDTLDKYNLLGKFKKPTKVIRNGTSIPHITSQEIEAFKSKHLQNSSYPVVSWVGLFVHKFKVEGLILLIEAFRIVCNKYCDAKLIVVGDGPFRDNVEKQIQLFGLQDNVIMTGMLKNVYPCFVLSDIYAHISFQEACPLTILEAMSVGTPVVSLKVGGIPEIVTDGENGSLVDDNANMIANGIISLYENKDMANNYKLKAYESINKEFNWEYVAKQYSELVDLLRTNT